MGDGRNHIPQRGDAAMLALLRRDLSWAYLSGTTSRGLPKDFDRATPLT
jgi:hypothetical protein